MNDDDTVRSSDEEQRGQRSGPPSPRSSGRGLIVSVFGDIRRAGSWSPRRTIWPFAVFGDIDLDLRQATILPGEVVINAVAPFGNVEVLVPDGVQVDVGGLTLLGSTTVAVEEATASESAMVIRVRGFSLFGSFKVRSS
jgi:Cell wall-active antibiotics response 4TMS YvqF